MLKIIKDLKDFRLVTQKIKPHKLAVIIYKIYVIVLTSN
jgi:hypothetical protein